MIGQSTKSVWQRLALGAAAAAFSALLLSPGSSVSAESGQAAGPSYVQALQTSAQMAYRGSVRFVNDMRALYQLAHLDEIVPAATEPARPKREERWKTLLCSESEEAPPAGRSRT